MARTSKYQDAALAALPRSTAGEAGLYLRLSVEDGDDLEHNSIGNQRRICMDFLKNQPEIQVHGVYTDHGCTGMNDRRAGFQAMLRDLQAGKINCVIVKDISRLGRHYIMTSEYVERIFPELGVRLICINDQYDSADPDANREGLLMPFRLIMNDTYVKDIARKIRSSIHAKMNCGEYLPAAGSVPYGYLRDPQESTYAVDWEAAAVVERIFRLRAEGLKFNAIAKRLNAEGVACPGRLRYDRGLTRAENYAHAEWVRGTIGKMAVDPVYLGHRIHGKLRRERLGDDKTRRDASEWKIIENAHPAIISQALYDAVQQVNQSERARRGTFVPHTPPEYDYRALFRDKLFCGDCLERMVPVKVTQRQTSGRSDFYAFECKQYLYSDRCRCGVHHVRQDTLMETLKHCLDRQAEIAVDASALLEELRQTPKMHRCERERRSCLASVRSQRAGVEAKSERLLVDLTEGLLDRAEYDRLRERYHAERQRLMAQEAEVQSRADLRMDGIHAARRWAAAMEEYRAMPQIDRALVDALVDKILVFSDKSIQISLRCGDPYGMAAASLSERAGGCVG